ncbi:UNVERIFIED_CONTAM: hypothetical protein Sindi_0539300 [Sesamum indicum]
MRESVDFHTNATPTFVGTRLREDPGWNPEECLKIHLGKDNVLSLASIKHYTQPGYYPLSKHPKVDRQVGCSYEDNHHTGAQLDKKNFIRLLELSLEGYVKVGWHNNSEDTKANILAEESKCAIAERLERLIKIHFIGDRYKFSPIFKPKCTVFNIQI